MRTFYLNFLLLMLPLSVIAQTISGTVTDAENNLPLPGVNISVENTTKGTTTDFDGNFVLNDLNANDVIIFQFLGYKTVRITYVGQNTLNISLETDTETLDEVVLIGYGQTLKEDVTGAVEKVSAEEFNRGAIVSPGSLLAGKTAGVRVTQGSGAPGAGPEIRIRAGSTLSGSQDPLIVIDGVPLDQQNANLNTINPDEIQDFTILKDASATAIYGSRASNGVIIITTKKGKKNTPLEITFDTQLSISEVREKVRVMSAGTFRDFITQRDDELNRNGQLISRLGNAETDWQDVIYRQGTSYIHNVTVSKGFENASLRVNLGNTEQNGILRTSNYKRTNLNIAYTHDFFDNRLKLTLTSQNAKEDIRNANQGAIGAAVTFDPTQPVFNPDGSLFQFRQPNGTLDLGAPANPLSILNASNFLTENLQTRNNLNLEFKVPYVDGLTLKANAGLDYNEFEVRNLVTAELPSVRFPQGNRSGDDGLRRNQNLDFTINYKHYFENLNLKIDIDAGHSYQEFTRQGQGFFTDASGQIENGFFIKDKNALESYYARGIFNIGEMLVLNGSVRRDGSSRFASNNRWGTFPAASFALKLDKTAFIENTNLFSTFKVRGGWGETGQQEIGPSFGFLGLFTPGNNQAQTQFGNQFFTTTRAEGFNADLKWEETTQYNGGIDFGFFDDRVTFSVDAYYRETEDLLAFVPVPAGSNLSNQLTSNVGETESKGLEFTLSATPIKTDDFEWSFSANLSFNETEIKKLNIADDPNFFIPVGGISGGVGNTIQRWSVGFDPTAFFVFRQVFDANGNPLEGVYVDVNGDNQITEADRVKYKQANPEGFFGFTNSMRYKKFDLNFTLRGAFGGHVYNNFQSANGFKQEFTTTLGNFVRNGSPSVFQTDFNNAQLFSDIYIQSADFIKLDNISLGYSLDFDKIKTRFSFTATNVFVITSYDGIDPEIPNGIDNNLFPVPRSYVLGASLTF